MLEDLVSISKEQIERISHKRYSDRALMRKLRRWEGPGLKKVMYEEEEQDVSLFF